MRFIFLFASLLLLSACRLGGNDQPTSADPVVEPPRPETAAAAPRPEPSRPAAAREAQADLPPLIDPARELPQFSGQLSHEGYGLSIPVDGTSPLGFQASLEIIAEESSPGQYQQLHSALEFLRVYSLGVRDLPTFYSSLDGLTGEDIIQRAADMRQRR